MRRTATILLLVWATTPALVAQTVETVLVSPLVSDYLALDAANGDLYTTNFAQVSRISPDGTIEVVADAQDFVTGIGVSASGDLYYAETVAGIVFKRDTAGVITEFATGLDDVIGIWMSRDNDGLYVQTYINPAAVYFIAFDGTVTEIISGLDDRATYIVVDESGNIYIAYFDFGTIKKILNVTGSVVDFAEIPSWLGYVTYVSPYIYATAWQTHEIYRIHAGTAVVELIAGTGDAGLVDGDALTEAQFNEPNGIVASVTGDTLYVTDISSNALRRITSVRSVAVEESVVQAEVLGLAQNYPNPFGGTTNIPYELSQTSHVTLSVTDLLGRNVATLVSETQAPGSHTVTWEVTDKPSGVYLYRLEVGSATQTGRMLLLP